MKKMNSEKKRGRPKSATKSPPPKKSGAFYKKQREVAALEKTDSKQRSIKALFGKPRASSSQSNSGLDSQSVPGATSTDISNIHISIDDHDSQPDIAKNSDENELHPAIQTTTKIQTAIPNFFKNIPPMDSPFDSDPVQLVDGSHTEKDERLNTPDTITNPVKLTDKIQTSSTRNLSGLFNIEFASPLSEKLEFLKMHPKQPETIQLSMLFTRKVGSSKIKRKWLSYDEESKLFYCTLCMAFTNSTSKFVSGVSLNIKHGSTLVSTHEDSQKHTDAANAFLAAEKCHDIGSLINVDLRNAKNKAVERNRDILKRICHWILCVGRQGIAYRGQFESSKYLSNPDLNHGNLLELLLTAAKTDNVLSEHFSKLISKSSIVPTTKGRGSKITWLSKTTINKLVEIIGDMIKNTVINEVKAAGEYSIMVDSTQDIMGHEQCAIVLRYVNCNSTESTPSIQEKLYSVLRLSGTTGEDYLDSVVTTLENHGISPRNIIGCSFDGASNMRGKVLGLQNRLRVFNDDLVFTWCYAHVLNLVVTDATTCVLAAKNIFGLLERSYSFFSESNKRVLVWEKLLEGAYGRRKLLRLENVGKTRWSSKHRAILKMFPSSANPEKGIYATLLEFLFTLKSNPTFSPEVSSDAGALLKNWCEMETILTALTFVRIFEVLGPISKYLQTKGLDMMSGWRMIQDAIPKLEKMKNDFAYVRRSAESLAAFVNECLDEEIDVEVECTLPVKRVRRRTAHFGEPRDDAPELDPWMKYEKEQYIIIFENTLASLQDRYVSNHGIINEISCFHPSRFEEILDNSLNGLTIIPVKLGLDATTLTKELQSFASQFRILTEPLPQVQVRPSETSSEEDSGDEESVETTRKCTDKKPCQNCIVCCYKLLCKYNMHSSSYSALFQVYKFILTLPCTQVECERVFSKLRIIKSRLRSPLKQYLLEAFILMSVERELTNELNVENIVDLFANSSDEVRRLLTYV